MANDRVFIPTATSGPESGQPAAERRERCFNPCYKQVITTAYLTSNSGAQLQRRLEQYR